MIPEQLPDDTNNEIAFVSDTQAPLWIEKIFLHANNNRTATKMIFADILKRRPLSLFLLGDVVSLGSSGRAWTPVTRYIDSCRIHGIHVFATLGNHELMGTGRMGKKGEKKFQVHFPEYSPTGFAEVIDSVAVILLNSNFSSLSKKQDAAQTDWYKNTLKKLDADPAILYVITGCHHSPYSNSKIVGSSKAVQQKFVQPFMQSKKSSLFLSGHSHNFEHFKKEGKDFLVIGGGGGLHQPLNTTAKHLEDLSPDYKPLFHYLTVRKYADHILVTSYKLTDEFSGFVPGMVMAINKPQTDL